MPRSVAAMIASTSRSSPCGAPSAPIARTSASSAGTAIASAARRASAGRGSPPPPRSRSSAAASTRALVEWQIRSASARNLTLAIGRETPGG